MGQMQECNLTHKLLRLEPSNRETGLRGSLAVSAAIGVEPSHVPSMRTGLGKHIEQGWIQPCRIRRILLWDSELAEYATRVGGVRRATSAWARAGAAVRR